MSDYGLHNHASIGDPAWSAATVTPADSDLPRIPTAGIYVGTAGNLAVTMAGGGTVTFANVPAGTVLPLRVDQVRSTNTTASNIIALYGV